ncbi:hypothetical protein Tco_1159546 [Tanacetum coccineum]
MVDNKDIIYTRDMFCSALKLPIKIIKKPFIPPADFSYIKEFIKSIGYQDLMEKYPSISKRLNEPYNTIKDDTPLSHMYTIREVIEHAMEILDDLLADEIK